MGKDRRINKNKSKKKISIAKRLGIPEERIYDAMKMFYKSIAETDCIIDTLKDMHNFYSQDDTIIDYFFVIGMIEFTKKFYGEIDEFNYEW